MENADPNITRVQHVAKASSDQLLRKFAEVGNDSNGKIPAKDSRLAKRVKRNQESAGDGNAKTSASTLAERKSLLPPAAAPRKPAALMRRLGISRAKIKARDIKNRSIITAIEKTWRRTVEGASRVLMEKHYNRHKRLINDSY
ncbi:hypothetical protein C2S51_021776 [Perilla frutescens var. frutescens]|nr:hypothetical protein C2S51_021776 [Perilla frutescens var. frutescens]